MICSSAEPARFEFELGPAPASSEQHADDSLLQEMLTRVDQVVHLLVGGRTGV